ncbi:TRAF4 [Acanthosepion pharaonis]|uniref:TRAF4 n=1 Tax=Acanthosepion pharaonis TaxID=158019 RepID=A0A812BNB9_ACAPH|nr:TRAF4 [Sepia pharaonis]
MEGGFTVIAPPLPPRYETPSICNRSFDTATVFSSKTVECLDKNGNAGVFKCPEDDKPLDYGKIFPDNDLYKEITSSIVRCKHYKEGCKWVDPLSSLQSHLDVCRYDAVSCPNSCSALLSRMCVHDHLEYTCPRRRVLCEFCGNEFSGEQMEQSHSGNCLYETVWCENKCGARLERRYLSNHMKNECHKRTVQCQFCKREFVEETLQTHHYQCPRFPIQCPNRCDPAKIPREEVDGHIKEHCPSVSVTCAFKEAGCKVKCQRFHLDSHMDENLKRHLSMAWDLVKQQQQEIRQLRNALHASTQVTNGNYIWRISDYKSKYLESAYKGAKELTCQPFYTSRHGYKVSASVFLNGYGNSDNKYLSLYFKILPGEYDNLLEWPFRLPVTFTLYDQAADQDKRRNIVERFMPDPTRKQFKKPHPDMESLGFGYPKFVSLETLKTKNYIKDDILYIGIKVDNKSFIVP